MFDIDGINSRYLSCFPNMTTADLARMHGITYPSVYQWKNAKRRIPWNTLKLVVDSQNVRWDWLIDGAEPKHRKKKRREECLPLSRHNINSRFLTLFPGYSQAKLGKILGVSQMTVYRWRHEISQVPWEKLKYAVDNANVTWEWLLEGRDG